ncbi:hypothetical protein OF829_09570 [Sphingomonas sp. LB-2]|uniref:phage tail sheath C-terminal domain-containing protein n=1 Tax=Sphingomonas caeni TaxID=2984949 RepID=UPI00222EC9E1|nr:phage tail sheath C-terminal domain-containing protein [Sphingomonas caeni]MCW3847491.1 hypothetical protein [Sphingomonas caeni]
MTTEFGSPKETPGVYVQELSAFPSAIVGVATAVPIFIGYTEFAGDPATGAALYNQPVAIASMADYARYFGGPAPQPYRIDPVPTPVPPGVTPDFAAYATSPNAGGGWSVASAGYLIAPAQAEPFLLYRQMQLFFANGGGNCFVVSAGSYWAGQLPVGAPNPQGWQPGSVTAAALSAALTAAGALKGPTMTVIPEACQLGAVDYATVATAMLDQAGSLQDRMAILDLPGCLSATTLDDLEAAQAQLWTALAPQANDASYGAVYAPAVNASLVQAGDLDFTRLASADNRLINDLLTTQAYQRFEPSPAQLASVQAMIAAAFPLPATLPKQNNPQYSGDAGGWPAGSDAAALNTALVNALPLYAQLLQLVAADINVQPVSGAIAGVWAQNDEINNVWNAPANIALASVLSPLCAINDAQQGAFNVPANGMAIDIIRAQVNRGNVVWGARTLDGNSNDYRYIQVRRTLIYVEQSIKAALRQFVFAANDSQTWTMVTALISNFLTQLWASGGLMGDKASDAFTVQCGLPATMTGQDVIDGNLIVAVTLQMTHPAEFILLTFRQEMQGS